MAELRRANLAAVVAVAARALGGELAAVPYDKGPRYDRSPRVRWPGLVAGAVESLAVTGALSRLMGLMAFGLGATGLAARGYPMVRLAMLGASVLAAGSSLWVNRRTPRALATMHAPHAHD
jgi:hypothetical protein